MSTVTAWLAYETSTTTGTGPYTLSGEPFDPATSTTFANVLADGEKTLYVAHGDGNNFEVNRGTWSAATNELSRDQHLMTTNGGDSINWGAGTKGVYAIQDPILSSAFLQATNNLDELNDPSTAQNNLGLGSMATEDVGDFVRKNVADQSITGRTLRLRGAGPNRFVAEDDAAGGDAWYGWRTGPDQGVIAHTDDEAVEQDVITFDHDILKLLPGLDVSGASGGVTYIRVGLSSDQTTGLTPGNNILFNDALDIPNPLEITLNPTTGIFTVPPGVWMLNLQVRIQGQSEFLGFAEIQILRDPTVPISGSLRAAVPSNAVAPVGSQTGTTFGLLVNTSPTQVFARIVDSADLVAIESASTQMLVVGFRR